MDRIGKRLYTDGGCIGSNPSKIGGTWAWCRVVNGEIVASNRDVFCPDMTTIYKEITNNQAELLAIIRGLQSLPDSWFGTIVSDSQISLGRVFEGHKMKNIPPSMIEQLNREKRRLIYFDKLPYKHVKGHPTKDDLRKGIGDPFNVWCDQQCNEVGQNYINWLKETNFEQFA